ncbi:MAG: hypothetical protein Q8N69_01440, partial [bacterium]|nr:hypothetical protein [bacterium]
PPKTSQPAKLFDDKRPLSRSGFRQLLRKDAGKIPGTMRKYSTKEREKIEGNVFGYKKFGSHISEQDYKRGIGNLEKDRILSKSYSERKRLTDKINYLKGFGEGQKK